MNTAIVGQVTDISQNKLGSKPGKSSGESPSGDSFAAVYADSSQAAPEAEQPEVSEAQGAVPGPDSAEENVEASDDQTDETHTEVDVAALVSAEAAAAPAGQASTDDNSVFERSGASQEDVAAVVASSVPETGAADGGEPETQAVADGTVQPAGEGVPLADASSSALRAQQSTPSGNGLDGAAKAAVPTTGLSQTNGISNGGQVQSPPGAQQEVAGAEETPVNGPVASQQPIGAGLTQAEVLAELARTSNGSIQDLPLAYRVRLGALSPAAQQAIHKSVASAVPTAAPVSPIAASVQNELALRQVTDSGNGLVANGPIDLPEGVELDGITQFEPAAASKTLPATPAVAVAPNAATIPAAAATPADDIPVAAETPTAVTAPAAAAAPTAATTVVPVNTSRLTQAGTRSEKSDEVRLEEVSTDTTAEDALLPGQIIREGGIVGATQVSQAALFAQIGQPQNNERFGHGAQQDFRLGPQAIGITQSLTEATFRPATIPTPEVAQRIAVQLTEAFAAKGERKVEVMLNPKELGQVKMQLSTSENGVRVIIHAERSETGDLMRRHISALENEFKDMGFENISFSFSSGDSQSQSGGNNQSGGSARQGQAVADEIETTPVGQQLNLGGSGLDMRV
ncbi:flagellar hook-length control protein FliK [Tritonibacter litoralis]|nr:flagellar hook-length control protein FliK [Tritonibacter litoralis]